MDLDGVKNFSQKGLIYYSLLDISSNEGYDFMCDDVLNAFYIWTYPDNKKTASINEEIERAVSLGIGTIKPDNPVITYAEFFKILDRVVELEDPGKLSAWQAQLSKARASNDYMTRYEGMRAILECAIALGDDYLSFNTDWGALNNKIGEKVWDEIGRIQNPDRYIPNDSF